jgi:hypothetical protein
LLRFELQALVGGLRYFVADIQRQGFFGRDCGAGSPSGWR